MHIVILEIALSGHHADYLTRLVDLFISQGHRVTVILQAEHHKNSLIGILLKAYPDKLKLVALERTTLLERLVSKFGTVGGELKNWLKFKRTYEELSSKEHIDQVFYPYLDYCLNAIALLGWPAKAVSCSGICMRPSFHYKKMGVIAPKSRLDFFKELLFKKLLNNKQLKNIYSIDELLCEYVKHKKLIYFPDPSDIDLSYSKEASRELLGIPFNNEKVVLVYGALDGRKGIDSLLNAAAQLAPEMRPAVLLVGRQSEAVKSLLKDDAGKQLTGNNKLYVIDRFVDAKDEGIAFAASDAVWLVYSGHYTMSGVLVKAVQAGLPVIATPNGLIGYYTTKHNLGVVFDGKHESLFSAINLGRQDKNPFFNHTWDRALSVIQT